MAISNPAPTPASAAAAAPSAPAVPVEVADGRAAAPVDPLAPDLEHAYVRAIALRDEKRFEAAVKVLAAQKANRVDPPVYSPSKPSCWEPTLLFYLADAELQLGKTELALEHVDAAARSGCVYTTLTYGGPGIPGDLKATLTHLSMDPSPRALARATDYVTRHPDVEVWVYEGAPRPAVALMLVLLSTKVSDSELEAFCRRVLTAGLSSGNRVDVASQLGCWQAARGDHKGAVGVALANREKVDAIAVEQEWDDTTGTVNYVSPAARLLACADEWVAQINEPDWQKKVDDARAAELKRFKAAVEAIPKSGSHQKPRPVPAVAELPAANCSCVAPGAGDTLLDLLPALAR